MTISTEADAASAMTGQKCRRRYIWCDCQHADRGVRPFDEGERLWTRDDDRYGCSNCAVASIFLAFSAFASMSGADKTTPTLAR